MRPQQVRTRPLPHAVSGDSGKAASRLQGASLPPERKQRSNGLSRRFACSNRERSIRSLSAHKGEKHTEMFREMNLFVSTSTGEQAHGKRCSYLCKGSVANFKRKSEQRTSWGLGRAASADKEAFPVLASRLGGCTRVWSEPPSTDSSGSGTSSRPSSCLMCSRLNLQRTDELGAALPDLVSRHFHTIS